MAHLIFADGVLWNCPGRYSFGIQGHPDCSRHDPTPEQWQAFWREVERLGVWEWLPEYTNDTLDGEQWTLELEFGGRRLATGGSNAYPGAPDGPGFPRDCAFGQFVTALETLSGSKLRLGE